MNVFLYGIPPLSPVWIARNKSRPDVNGPSGYPQPPSFKGRPLTYTLVNSRFPRNVWLGFDDVVRFVTAWVAMFSDSPLLLPVFDSLSLHFLSTPDSCQILKFGG